MPFPTRRENPEIRLAAAAVLLFGAPGALGAADLPESLPRYYAHSAVEDSYGVIAPWHRGQNGPCDERIRIAVEVYRRYPWVEKDRAVLAAPHLIYNTHWKIDEAGSIEIPPAQPWMCGDLSQRAISVVQGLTRYYAYAGDPLAFVYVPLLVDYTLDWCLTPPDHPWPRFPVSTPTKGAPYGKADPAVANQLDLCAYLGLEVLRAHRLTGTQRYLEASRSWAETIAKKCNLADPDVPPWSRYANPEHMLWSDELTGGVSLIVEFLDAVLETGFEGEGGAIRRARDAGRDYLARDLLPRWMENEVWGRHYWDMEGALYCGVVPWISEHFLDRPEAFPQWKTDVRNILGLVFARNCADPASRGGVYSGAWAFPESSICCGTSLSYNQYTYAPAFLRYGALAGDERMREIGRRMLLMALYDSSETGRVLDGLEGTVVAAGDWLNLAHPWPLCQALKAISIAPELFAPARENHIVRTSSVVTHVVYGDGRIEYATRDARPPAVDVLRLAFEPSSVLAGGVPLPRRRDLRENGCVVEALGGGDFLLSARHDGSTKVVVEGDDPQREIEDGDFRFEGAWARKREPEASGGSLSAASERGASAEIRFFGNQVRVVGSVGPSGGLADVTLDGRRELGPIDCWNPAPRHRQILYRRSGLANGPHELRIAVRGEGNLASSGADVFLDAVQVSDAIAEARFGEGGGPRGAQRMIFGRPHRTDYVDSAGNVWRPGTEFVVRLGYGADAVARALWTDRRSIAIANTPDPELFRYGLHGKDFTVALTVGPGLYAARLFFAETGAGSVLRATIDGRTAIEELDVAEAAGGKFRALELEFPGIEPRHGVVALRFEGLRGREACLQALALLPCEPGAAWKVYRPGAGLVPAD